ncbi:hypothetical protein ACFLZY_00390, partial [Patescibacteria group bacterium]
LLLEGMYLHLWQSVGGEKKGHELIVAHRFLLVQIAQALKHPQAKAWASQLTNIAKHVHSKRLRGFYKQELR